MNEIDYKANIITVCTYSHLKKSIIAIKRANKFGHFNKNYIFVIDAYSETIDYINTIYKDKTIKIEFFSLYELSKSEKKIFKNAFKYFSAMELCCLAQYIGIKHVLTLSKKVSKCIYIDNDIYFFKNLESTLDKIKDKALLVVPHYIFPSRESIELETFISGYINSGFSIYNSQNINTYKILDWLIDRIAENGFWAPGISLYCDQIWLTRSTQLFSESTIVLKDIEYNVGYFNLHERNLTTKNNKFFVNGKELIFFNFSGFLYDQPKKLSKHLKNKKIKNTSIEILISEYKNDLDSFNFNLKNLKTIPLNKLKLGKRIFINSKIFKKNLQLVMDQEIIYDILFTKIGRKIDSFIMKFLNIIK